MMGLLGTIIIGGAAEHYAARRQFEALSAAQAQQAQIDQTQAQAAHAAQAPSQGKDMFEELERLGSLKQQGLITEEEFQKLKMRLLSGI